ncbi:MAG: M4 family metallopeptidase, partial [Planctomycetaceae bacterium]|nr:M4 family metallopeptidase [Planctomycetaceae bacterium]
AISQQQALESIAKLAKVDPATVKVDEPAELTFFFKEEAGDWHLAFLFNRVPVAPANFANAAGDRRSHGHGQGPSPCDAFLQLNYLVDAHDGEVLFYYSANPTLSRCKGIDELGVSHVFYGLKNDARFELSDPLRRIKTYDLELMNDVGSPLPTNPVSSIKADWGETNRAAISAHVNAQRVYDFYKSVLMRDGIDDKGMELVSVVNCTYSAVETPPQWHNGVWWQNRMWYGQDQDGNDTLRSYARYLDIIAHELTHGVTQYTSNLVYRNQSGALNESFSDIFGVIINDWDTIGSDSEVAGWNWEIGPGLGGKGNPLRDLSHPERTGDPDHMENYLKTTSDSGGVHTNSNIHNKAAYNVLTAVDKDGQRAFPPRDVAVLYYLCLQRLGQLADFSKALQALVLEAKTFYVGDPEECEIKVKQIEDAYKKVGIVNKKAVLSPKEKVGNL